MDPLPRIYSVFEPIEVPVVLVGEALENCHPVNPWRRSPWDSRPVQLWKVRIRVEKLINGDIGSRRSLDVFYVMDLGASSSGWSKLTDIYAGHSEIFFLRPYGSDFRTICDDWRSCVSWVRTGAHYKYKLDPELTIQDDLADILLNRGDQTTDAQMVDAIYHPDGRWGWEPVLKTLKTISERDRSATVRAVANDRLRQFRRIYGVDPDRLFRK